PRVCTECSLVDLSLMRYGAGSSNTATSTRTEPFRRSHTRYPNFNRARMQPMKAWFNNAPIRAKILVCAITIVLIVGAMSGVVYGGIVVSQSRDQLVER